MTNESELMDAFEVPCEETTKECFDRMITGQKLQAEADERLRSAIRLVKEGICDKDAIRLLVSVAEKSLEDE